MLVVTMSAVNTEPLTIKHTGRALLPTLLVAKWTMHSSTRLLVACWHLGQVILMQKLARRSFHAKTTQPMSTNDSAETRIMLSTRNDKRFILVNLFEYRFAFLVGQWIPQIGNAVIEGIVLEIIGYYIKERHDSM
jgi:hypothetical protein